MTDNEDTPDMTTTTYRQGDVLVIARPALPQGLVPVERDAGRIVLAYGEVTGHAHAIRLPQATYSRDAAGGFFLHVPAGEPAALEHEEHSTIRLPPGDYEVRRQVEYTPAAIRVVAD